MIYKDLTGLTGEPVSPAPSGEAELIIRARGRGAEALTDEIWEHRCAQLGARPGGGSGCTEDSARHRPQSPRDGVAGETRDDLVPPTGLVWLLAPKPGLCSGVSAPLPGFGGSCTQPGGGMADRLASGGRRESRCAHTLGRGNQLGTYSEGLGPPHCRDPKYFLGSSSRWGTRGVCPDLEWPTGLCQLGRPNGRIHKCPSEQIFSEKQEQQTGS